MSALNLALRRSGLFVATTILEQRSEECSPPPVLLGRWRARGSGGSPALSEVAIVLSVSLLGGCIKDIGIPDPFGGGPTLYSIPTSSPTVSGCTSQPWSIGPLNSSTGVLDLTAGLSKEVRVGRDGCSPSMVTSVTWEVDPPSLAAVVSLGSYVGVVTGSASGQAVLTGRILFLDGVRQSVHARVLISPAASPSTNHVLAPGTARVKPAESGQLRPRLLRARACP